MTDIDTTREALLDAALMHVPFDGWSETSFNSAARDAGLELAEARAVCPRGALDLAVAFHRRGDAAMMAHLAKADLQALKVRDRVTEAVRVRIEAINDKEAVRRGSALFALPQNAVEGAQLIWGTADAIWTALGDPSDDLNWYTKRAILSGVYSAVVLYWLGDESPGHQATWAFLDRRIEDVMRFENVKAQMRSNPALKPFMAFPDWLASQVKAPSRTPRVDLPGRWTAGR
ncbi:MAG: COQ9 family protein [Rhodobacter sp.]|nr:COQ9 family protein [Rhodobacter sp.]